MYQKVAARMRLIGEKANKVLFSPFTFSFYLAQQHLHGCGWTKKVSSCMTGRSASTGLCFTFSSQTFRKKCYWNATAAELVFIQPHTQIPAPTGMDHEKRCHVVTFHSLTCSQCPHVDLCDRAVFLRWVSKVWMPVGCWDKCGFVVLLTSSHDRKVPNCKPGILDSGYNRGSLCYLLSWFAWGIA